MKGPLSRFSSRTLELPDPPEAVYDAAVETARGMVRWTIVARSAPDRFFHAEARTRLLRFTDDVRVRVEETESGGSRVRVRSESRVGIYDFGTNARRIRSYLKRLGRNLR